MKDGLVILIATACATVAGLFIYDHLVKTPSGINSTMYAMNTMDAYRGNTTGLMSQHATVGDIVNNNLGSLIGVIGGR